MIKVEASSDLKSLSAQLREMAQSISDLRQPNEQAAIDLYGWVMRNFDSEGELGGDRWQDLKLKGRWKGKGHNRYFQTDYKILQDTGALRQSFEWFSDAEGAGVGARAYASTEDKEAPEDIAAYHQYGAGGRNLPARPMLPDEDTAIDIVVAVYDQYIRDTRLRNNL